MKKIDGIVCPYCEQDWVYQVALGEVYNDSYPYGFCYECDTFWLDLDHVSDETGEYFKSFMERRGQEADWELLKKGGILPVSFFS